MKISIKILIHHLLLLCCIFSIVLGDATINKLPDYVTPLGGVYIIRYEQKLTPNIILDRIRYAGINYTHRFNLEIIDSVSVKFDEDDAVHKCSKISGVEHIWPVSKIKPRLFTAHKVSGVDVFRQRTGFDGRGIKVGIVDNGLDYTHPAFGNCFKTPGCKTQFGSDLIGVGDHFNPVPDNDPFESCEGHGTHVAGIVAANDPVLHFTGVAPNVTLGIYRAIDCGSESSDDILIRGMQLAAADNMDIVNLSLGVAFRAWNGTPLSNAASNLVKQGIVVVVSASNVGTDGLFGAGDPDSATDIVSVGDVDNIQYIAFVLTLSSVPNREIQYATDRLTLRFRLPIPLPITIANTTTNLPENDGCDLYDKDMSNKLALIRRGGCGFDVKVKNAVKAGAVGVIFYDNIPELVDAISFTNPPSALISEGDGEFVKEQIRKHGDITVYFPNKTVTVRLESAGKPTNESSWGPTFDMDIKPEFLAPGNRIFSTYPIALGRYATISGTSMSAAYASGTIALFMQAKGLRKGNFDPIKLRDFLMHTSSPICNDTSNDLFPVVKQGGGLLNINEAIKTTTHIQPSKLLLNDTAHFRGIHHISITNKGHQTTKYTLLHVPTPSVRGFFNNTWVSTDSLIFENQFARVTLSKNQVIVRPGVTAKITVKFTPPKHLPNDFGVYSGYISIKDSSKHTTSHLSYLGVKGNLHNVPVLSFNPSPDFFRSSDNEVFNENNPIGRFTFINDDFPVFEYAMNFGSRFTKIELFKNGDFTSNGFVGFPIFDQGFSNPSFLFPRNGPSAPTTIKPWSSRMVSDINGQNSFIVPPGQYQALLTILNFFGNPNNKKDFVTFKFVTIEIVNPTTTTAIQNVTTTTTSTRKYAKMANDVEMKQHTSTVMVG